MKRVMIREVCIHYVEVDVDDGDDPEAVALEAFSQGEATFSHVEARTATLIEPDDA